MSTFKEIQDNVYTKMQESSSNTAFPLASVKEWINEAYREICSFYKWSFLIDDAVKDCVYTACSDVGTSTGTTLYVDSVSNMFTGQKLIVTDGTIYEEVEVSDASTTTVTLVSPGLSSSYTDGDIVSGVAIEKPDDFYKTLILRCQKISSSTQSVSTLVRNMEREQQVIYPYVGSTGTPSNYYERDSLFMLYPAPDYAYRIFLTYIKIPTDLSDDSDTPVFPKRYHKLLEYYAIANCYEKDDSFNEASFYRQMFEKGLFNMRNDYATKYDGLISFRANDDKDLPSFSF